MESALDSLYFLLSISFTTLLYCASSTVFDETEFCQLGSISRPHLQKQGTKARATCHLRDLYPMFATSIINSRKFLLFIFPRIPMVGVLMDLDGQQAVIHRICRFRGHLNVLNWNRSQQVVQIPSATKIKTTSMSQNIQGNVQPANQDRQN